MATSTFPTVTTGVTVQTATNGALSGDGSSGNKLAVAVDGSTITVNGSDQLVGAFGGSIADTQVAVGSGTDTIAGHSNLTNAANAFNGRSWGFGTVNDNISTGFTANANQETVWRFVNLWNDPLAQNELSLQFVDTFETGTPSLSLYIGKSNDVGEMRLTGLEGLLLQNDVDGAPYVQIRTIDSGMGGASHFWTFDAGGALELPSVAFADLPGSPAAGMVAYITDADTVTWGATIGGGNTNKVLAWYNGSHWTVAGK